MQDNFGNRIIEVYDASYDNYVKDIAMNLRIEDFDEVYAATGGNPFDAVLEDWMTSIRKWIIFNKQNIAVAVLGVRPLTMFSDIGIPWLLGADGLNKMKMFFIKNSKTIIEEMKKNFRILINCVDSRYVKAIRWLEWCGFTIDDAVPIGADKVPFHMIYMECN